MLAPGRGCLYTRRNANLLLGDRRIYSANTKHCVLVVSDLLEPGAGSGSFPSRVSPKFRGRTPELKFTCLGRHLRYLRPDSANQERLLSNTGGRY